MRTAAGRSGATREVRVIVDRRVIAAVAWAVLANGAMSFGQRAPGPFNDSKTLPDTPAAKRLNELLELLRSAKEDRIRGFVAESFSAEFRESMPLAEHLAALSENAESVNRYELYGSRQYDPPRPDTTVTAIFRDPLLESWQAIVLEVEPAPPHRIARLQFAPARPPADAPVAAKRTDAEIVAELEKFLHRLAEADAFSGTVLLAKDGQPLFKRAYGQACKSFDVPNNIETKFNLGSMNKMFTATAIAQLVERAKLSFTDPISKYLSPEWLPKEVADKITIEQLLSHTSGLGSYFNDEFMRSSRTRFRSVADYKPLVAGETPAFTPGTQWSYSNTGFLLLGAIIEKVSGKDYHDFVRENITGPAGMTNTDCYDMDLSVPNLALGYMKGKAADGSSVWRTNIFEHVCKGGPAGGGYSTVEDLMRFDQAMRNNKLVSATTKEIMWSPKPGSPDYGYGFGLRGGPGNRVVGHNGGFPGVNGSLAMYLDAGYTLAVLANYDGAAEVVQQKVQGLLGGSR